MQDAARLELLEELDHQSILFGVLSKLIRGTHVHRKPTGQRHRQRDLKTVIGKMAVIVSQVAQEKHRVAVLKSQAQETVRAGLEWSDAVAHFAAFLYPLPPGSFHGSVRCVQRRHRLLGNTVHGVAEEISQQPLTFLKPKHDRQIDRCFTDAIRD